MKHAGGRSWRPFHFRRSQFVNAANDLDFRATGHVDETSSAFSAVSEEGPERPRRRVEGIEQAEAHACFN